VLQEGELMEAKESYDERLKMVEMHDDVLNRIDKAINNNQSIEACWLCYSCFESRIVRTLEKISVGCHDRRCFLDGVSNPRVGINTRIDCLKRLHKNEYFVIESFDVNTFQQIALWCKERNALVHALLTLNNYMGMDEKFLGLAKKGKPLVDALYNQTTSFRNQYYVSDIMLPFPKSAMEKCQLLKRSEQSKEKEQ
jgi:hypothetical protein